MPMVCTVSVVCNVSMVCNVSTLLTMSSTTGSLVGVMFVTMS